MGLNLKRKKEKKRKEAMILVQLFVYGCGCRKIEDMHTKRTSFWELFWLKHARSLLFNPSAAVPNGRGIRSLYFIYALMLLVVTWGILYFYGVQFKFYKCPTGFNDLDYNELNFDMLISCLDLMLLSGFSDFLGIRKLEW